MNDKDVAKKSYKAIKKFFIEYNQKEINKIKLPKRETLNSIYLFSKQSSWLKKPENEIIDSWINKTVVLSSDFEFIHYKIPKNQFNTRDQTLLSPSAFAYTVYLIEIIRQKFKIKILDKNFNNISVWVGVDFDVENINNNNFIEDYWSNYQNYISSKTKVDAKNQYISLDISKCYSSISQKLIKNFLINGCKFSEKEAQYINHYLKYINRGKQGLVQIHGSTPVDGLFRMIHYWIIKEYIASNPDEIEFFYAYVDDSYIKTIKQNASEVVDKINAHYKKYDLELNNSKSLVLKIDEDSESDVSKNIGEKELDELVVKAKKYLHWFWYPSLYWKKFNDEKIIAINQLFKEYVLKDKIFINSPNCHIILRKVFSKTYKTPVHSNKLYDLLIKSLSIKPNFPKYNEEKLPKSISKLISKQISTPKFLNSNIKLAAKSLRYIQHKEAKQALNQIKKYKYNKGKINEFTFNYMELRFLLININENTNQNEIISKLKEFQVKKYKINSNFDYLFSLSKIKNNIIRRRQIFYSEYIDSISQICKILDNQIGQLNNDIIDDLETKKNIAYYIWKILESFFTNFYNKEKYDSNFVKKSNIKDTWNAILDLRSFKVHGKNIKKKEKQKNINLFSSQFLNVKNLSIKNINDKIYYICKKLVESNKT